MACRVLGKKVVLYKRMGNGWIEAAAAVNYLHSLFPRHYLSFQYINGYVYEPNPKITLITQAEHH